nr:hypothetical protein B0A51_07251 [Rachicladosporium sp. CCFEE 5018]
MATANAVFDIPELLGNILLHIDDWKAPFVLLRVSKTFKGTIDGSARLRKGMWLSTEVENLTGPSTQQNLNPLLANLGKDQRFKYNLGNSPVAGWTWWARMYLLTNDTLVLALQLCRLSAEYLLPDFGRGDHNSATSSWRNLKCSSTPGFTAFVNIDNQWSRHTTDSWAETTDIDLPIIHATTLAELMNAAQAVVTNMDFDLAAMRAACEATQKRMGL